MLRATPKRVKVIRWSSIGFKKLDARLAIRVGTLEAAVQIRPHVAPSTNIVVWVARHELLEAPIDLPKRVGVVLSQMASKPETLLVRIVALVACAAALERAESDRTPLAGVGVLYRRYNGRKVAPLRVAITVGTGHLYAHTMHGAGTEDYEVCAGDEGVCGRVGKRAREQCVQVGVRATGGRASMRAGG